MNTRELTNDAKAILLLCGRFGKNDAVKPLNLREYNRLADWMQNRHIRPSDLIGESGRYLFKEAPSAIDNTRIHKLLARGAAMALAIEKWTNSGIWVVCRSDAAYPQRLKQHLKRQSPPILYGIGDIALLSHGGLAVVGSRNVNAGGQSFTQRIAEESTRCGIQIVSGGARGVDQTAMISALNAGGNVVGILADSLLKAAVAKNFRNGIREKRLVLISAYNPEARFNVGNAMGRNKYIYALADCGLVIDADVDKGGTWAGATEELRRNSGRPVFVRVDDDATKGNQALLRLGALPFPKQPWGKDLFSQLKKKDREENQKTAKQTSLFNDELPFVYPEEASIKEPVESYTIEKDSRSEGKQDASQIQTTIPANIYEAVLPLILSKMDDWRSPKDMVKELGVRKVQLDEWLKRAIKEEKVEKKSRPVRYRRK
jgi:predicted Rossmann fold nucleotide-binding protein DprA/Smf involved in DNA uptake